jgi:hypothetical protein
MREGVRFRQAVAIPVADAETLAHDILDLIKKFREERK